MTFHDHLNGVRKTHRIFSDFVSHGFSFLIGRVNLLKSILGSGASRMHSSRAAVFVQRICLAISSSCLMALRDRRNVMDFLDPPFLGLVILAMMYFVIPGLYYKRNTLS